MLKPRWSGPKIAKRTRDEIASLERAGEVVAEALRRVATLATPGATTAAINDEAALVLHESGATPLFRGYRQGDAPPFPADACVSVNDEIVHGIPSAERVLRPGDVVSVDVGVILDGWCGDSATTIIVPADERHPLTLSNDQPTLEERRRLVRSTREVLDLSVELCRAGRAWSEVALELERATAEAGYGYIAEYVGHGIGRRLHEPPKAPCYWGGYTGSDFVLQSGMVLAIEPLLVLGGGVAAGAKAPVHVAADGWTVLGPGGSVACHEEYMVAVGKRGGRVLSGGGRADLP